MPRGGARVRSGPPPDPNALRRDRPSDAAGWVHLPAAGRSGSPPAWPLARPKPRELILWAGEWRRPQALMWEALGLANQVAVYVRTLVVTEGPKATASDRSTLLRQEAELGLSVGGLARNRWIIDRDEPAQQVTRTNDPDRASAKARFKALEGGVAS